MNLEGSVIRPPNEGDSILLQATLGCSHNKCAFCGAYQGKRFAIKDQATVFADIEFAADYCRNIRRVFICDGDGLIMPQTRWIELLERIRQRLPWVTRVGTYANAKSIALKTDHELTRLKELGLSTLYMGLESGDDPTLARMNKKGDSTFIIAQGLRARQAGLKLSVTVLLGLAGQDRSKIHAESTAAALTAMDPEQVGALSLMLIPGTPLHQDWKQGKFTQLTPPQLLHELKTIIEQTNLTRGLFMANHASNHLPLKLRLPRDKQKGIALLNQALQGRLPLKPERFRAL